MDLALSVAHGITFLDRPTTRKRVLYLNMELKAQTFERRLQAVAQAKGVDVEPGWFYHLPVRGRMTGVTLDGLISKVIRFADHLHAELVVADPVYKMNLTGDENSSRDQTLFFNQIDRLTTEAGCTVILNDHFSKGNQSEKDPLDAIRGSSAKGGDVDAAMILRKHDEQECFRVDVIHRELPPIPPFCIGWQYPLMVHRPNLNPDHMKKPAGGRQKSHDPLRLLAAISGTTAEKPVSISGWADTAGIVRSTLDGYLPQIRDKGWITTVGAGTSARQHITPKGLHALQEAKL
jgi:hypothetical protein